MTKRLAKKGWLWLAVVLGLCLSCQVNIGTDDDDDDDTAGVDMVSHNTDAALVVKNETSKDLVAFKGRLSADALIGGVPAGAQQHYLEKKAGLFTKTEDFALIFLTLEQYNANKGNLGALENAPFTRVWAFYNASEPDLNTVINISGTLGGDNKLVIQNMTSM